MAWPSETAETIFHPDILERQPDGLLYRYMLADEDMRQALFDYLAYDRVASAWARTKDADLDRLRTAVERYG